MTNRQINRLIRVYRKLKNYNLCSNLLRRHLHQWEWRTMSAPNLQTMDEVFNKTRRGKIKRYRWRLTYRRSLTKTIIQ